MATTFHSFPLLPTELRIEIWSRARKNRSPAMIPLVLSDPGRWLGQPHIYTSPLRTPPLLHACHESRNLFLDHYSLCFEKNIRYRHLMSESLDIWAEEPPVHVCKDLRERSNHGIPVRCCFLDFPGSEIVVSDYGPWYDIGVPGSKGHDGSEQRNFWDAGQDLVFLTSMPGVPASLKDHGIGLTDQRQEADDWWERCDLNFKGVKNLAMNHNIFCQRRDKGSVWWEGLESEFLW